MRISKTGLMPIYILALTGMLFGAFLCSRTVDTFVFNAAKADRPTVVIDAGHGGVDGGAVSIDGIFESAINLQIAIKLNDLLHFLGIQTKMIRTGDYSVFTSGNTIGKKKISDLKERVRVTNETNNGLLISLHQNYFYDSRYSGPQVFYASTEGSHLLATSLQSTLNKKIAIQSKRKAKPASNIYLMEKTECTGVLIECGFLSNPIESKKLQDSVYQRKLCCVIACVTAEYLSNRHIA